MTTDVRELYRRAQDTFGEYVHGVHDDQWSAPTPCSEWDVHALVNHVLGEILWVVPLLDGRTIAEVGNRFDGDLLGDDPAVAWDQAAPAALAAVDAAGAMDRTVHLSFGDFPGGEYAMQLFADLLVHGWDLATATGQHNQLDPELVDACAVWFGPISEAYRGAGATGAKPDLAPDADAQQRLLAEFGRTG